jgi:hypothetical protein
MMKTLLISILLGCSVCCGLAQTPASPAATTNQLSVRLWLFRAKTFQAPATINIQAYVRMQGPGLRAGDFVNVEFFANSKSIGTAKAIWHGEVRPQVAPGQAVPMWIIPAGFKAAVCAWKNVPAGNYSLAARATLTPGLSAVSAAVSITVVSQ